MRENPTETSSLNEALNCFAAAPGYLEATGWLRSMISGQVVDRRGNPLPWLTYPAVEFLAARVHGELEVFEYGSGNSTLWWSRRVKRVVSCEHDKEWYARYRSLVPENVSYLLRRYKGGSSAYREEIKRYRARFDILVVDGRQRVACIENGLAALGPAGVVIIDNSDRSRYRPGYQLLATTGYNQLDFWGLGALSTNGWCTSVFYRDKNCLAI